MTLKSRVRSLLRGSISLTCLAYGADNFLAGVGLAREEPVTPDSLDYAKEVLGLFSVHPVKGEVAEVGPGGSSQVAKLLLEAGAERVDLVDRFGIAQLETDPRITWQVGEGAETFFVRRQYDRIYSCAVLEHLYDPVGGLFVMASALKPGGAMVHQVDLRDHNMFEGHELTFLTIPSWAWPHMSRNRGRPNRVPLNRYHEALRDSGLTYEILATHLVGVGKLERPMLWPDIPQDAQDHALDAVEQIRSRLAAEFAGEASENLAVSGILISAWR